jgi:hypothetical protein
MRKPLEFMIEKMWEDGVDMLQGFSLAQNSSALKYAMAWKDFDINADYSTGYIAGPFELTKKRWQIMCACYKRQDQKKNRSIADNVDLNDYEYIL